MKDPNQLLIIPFSQENAGPLIWFLFRHMKDPNQLLIIPITFWVGVEQGH
jgi:hypothetical protein